MKRVGMGNHTVVLSLVAVSYTHLRAHETPEHLVCRLLLEKKNTLLFFSHTKTSENHDLFSKSDANRQKQLASKKPPMRD